MRKFAVIEKFKDKEIHLPERSTKYSAGYDMEAAEDTTIPVHGDNGFRKGTLVPTGLKVYCHPDEYVALVSRSSNFNKLGLMLANSVGVIDSDYSDNPGNEGHILFNFVNLGNQPVTIKKGTRIGQAIFQKFCLTDDDDASGVRQGGFGSTGSK